jgi:hypothetical protein
MNYLEYVATPAEIAAVEDRNRRDETDFHGRVLHDLLALGRDIVNVQSQKAFIQGKHLARDPRDIELRQVQDLTVTFDRLARGIRMAILLHQKIMDLARTPVPDPPDGAACGPAEPVPAPSPDGPIHPGRADDVTRQPAARIIAKVAQDLTAGLGPRVTPSQDPAPTTAAAIETLRTHLAAGPPPGFAP